MPPTYCNISKGHQWNSPCLLRSHRADGPISTHLRLVININVNRTATHGEYCTCHCTTMDAGEWPTNKSTYFKKISHLRRVVVLRTRGLTARYFPMWTSLFETTKSVSKVTSMRPPPQNLRGQATHMCRYGLPKDDTSMVPHRGTAIVASTATASCATV